MDSGFVALIAFVLGTTSGWLWSRWRHQVVSELRTIRRILEHEQEPVLRAIRDHLVNAPRRDLTMSTVETPQPAETQPVEPEPVEPEPEEPDNGDDDT